jgi:catechol 2,3-dioxygenase-like lactoylglutathione lyase family enzyme
MAVTVARIGHVAITVRDRERTVDFYGRFGLGPTNAGGGL